MKRFNTTGTCFPEDHYMVDLTERVAAIKAMVDAGNYFCINCGRQYGKTTTLEALRQGLAADYVVFSLSFEGVDECIFSSDTSFASAFLSKLHDQLEANIVPNATDILCNIVIKWFCEHEGKCKFSELFMIISRLCKASRFPVVIMIDEFDLAANYESILSLLGMFRARFLNRHEIPAVHSVVFAGIQDIRNLEIRNRPENQHKSPWNIATPFTIPMELSAEGIAGMLTDYEQDHHTGMDVTAMATMLFEYTGGYPFLVSRLCQIMDEELKGTDSFDTLAQCWTKAGLLAAEKSLLDEKNALFDDIFKKLADYPALRNMLFEHLCHGRVFDYVNYNINVSIGKMLGLVRRHNESVAVANIIFETLLYNVFMSEMRQATMSDNRLNSGDRSQFIVDGHLDMKRVLERFIDSYQLIYNGSPFIEKDGRMLFLFFLKPIINGIGHYYVEPQTRTEQRMDIVVNYNREQFIIELKIWRGEAYNTAGVEQLCGYLEQMHETRGYLVTFNFTQNKQIGMQTSSHDGKTIVQVTV